MLVFYILLFCMITMCFVNYKYHIVVSYLLCKVCYIAQIEQFGAYHTVLVWYRYMVWEHTNTCYAELALYCHSNRLASVRDLVPRWWMLLLGIYILNKVRWTTLNCLVWGLLSCIGGRLAWFCSVWDTGERGAEGEGKREREGGRVRVRGKERERES